MARLVGLFGAITVIIAMMGVYGLIFFNARYRTREIAIRRVNGANVGEVMAILNRAMFTQLAVAFVLATVIAWLIIRWWLDGFAYRAAVPWWLYPAAGVIVLLIAVATVSIQSWRAATANPVRSLKTE
jgi:putative ABC transport system permease protein